MHYVEPPARKVPQNLARDAAYPGAGHDVRGLFGPGFLQEPSALYPNGALSYSLGCRTFESLCTPTRSGAIPAESLSTSRGWVTRRFWTRRTT